jgi:hypothetical protein
VTYQHITSWYLWYISWFGLFLKFLLVFLIKHMKESYWTLIFIGEKGCVLTSYSTSQKHKSTAASTNVQINFDCLFYHRCCYIRR